MNKKVYPKIYILIYLIITNFLILSLVFNIKSLHLIKEKQRLVLDSSNIELHATKLKMKRPKEIIYLKYK